jgi:hypothetical protein
LGSALHSEFHISKESVFVSNILWAWAASQETLPHGKLRQFVIEALEE